MDHTDSQPLPLPALAPEHNHPPAAPMRLLSETAPPESEQEARVTLATRLFPYRNLRALIAYYCAIFGLVPLVGLFLGPAAIVFGIFGATWAEAHADSRGMYHALFAIVLGTVELTAHIVLPLTLLIFFDLGFLQEVFRGIFK